MQTIKTFIKDHPYVVGPVSAGVSGGLFPY